MVGRRANALAIVQLDLEERVPADEPGRFQTGDDQSPVWPDAVPPKELARSVARCHFLERQRGSIDQRDPGIAAEATRVGAFSETNSENRARNPEILHRARERERIRRNDAHGPFEIHEGLLVEALRVDDGGIDVGENLEFVRAAHVVTVARGAIRDDLAAIGDAHLLRGEGLDHAVLGGHAPDPPITLDAHDASMVILGNTEL